jgi:hypothetical protein
VPSEKSPDPQEVADLIADIVENTYWPTVNLVSDRRWRTASLYPAA